MTRIVLSLVMVVLSACTGSHAPSASTQTGNPPVLDLRRITLETSNSEVHIVGKPGAVKPGGTRVEIENRRTGAVVEVTADADGSFDARVDGSLDDEFAVRAINSSGRSETVRVTRGAAMVGGRDGSDDLVNDAGSAGGTSGGASGSTNAGSQAVAGSGNAGAGAQDAGASPEGGECVVAMSLRECCYSYKPVTRAQLAADECLVELPATTLWGTDVTGPCRTISCVGVMCDLEPPPSRLAASDGAGGCRYTDECERDSDCALGSATSGCCDCLSSMPVRLFEQNPCALRSGEPLPSGPIECRTCTAPVQCGMCEPAAPPRCTIGDAFNQCD